MKNLIITIFFLATSLISSANKLEPIKDFNNNVNKIAISFNVSKQFFEFNFDSAEELQHFNLETVRELILATDKCEGNATITVTAQAGFGSTFISISITIEVPCEDVISETKKLKDKLVAVMK